MNSVTTVRLYIKFMLQEVEGPKVILLDRFTRRLLSLVYTHSEILQKDVLLIDMLDNRRRDKLQEMKCVVFVSSTEDSISNIVRELSAPKYNKFYLYFTNVVSEEMLRSVSEADKKNVVDSVKVVFTDYLSPDPSMFIVPIPSSIPLYLGKDSVTDSSSDLTRVSRSLISVLLTMTKKKPILRYCQNSQACTQVCEEIERIIFSDEEEASSLSNTANTTTTSSSTNDVPTTTTTTGTFLKHKRNENRPLLLILDRRHDSVTPLLSQWTYQAMVHENIGKGIRNNIVVLKKEQKRKKKNEEENEEEEEENEGEESEEEDEIEVVKQEILFSLLFDEFLYHNKDRNWGEVCDAMKKLVERYKITMKSKDKMVTVEDMKRFFDQYEEIRKLNRETNDHMTLVFELKSQIKQRKLLHLSKLEQEIVSAVGNSKHNEHFKTLQALLRQKIRKDDAIRIALIYILRYESFSDNRISSLLDELSECGFDRRELGLLTDGILRYGGEKVRNSGLTLFREARGIKGIFKRVKASLEDIENVFTQHEPLIRQIIQQLAKGKLSERHFPHSSQINDVEIQSSNHHPLFDPSRPRRIFVFVVGGITYEEVKSIREFNKENRKNKVMVMLGGTEILNSSRFIKNVKSFSQELVGNVPIY